jgi:DNA-binding GntR family transcriptional regulator
MPAVPDYRRIADDIRSKVRSGALQPGDRLPKKREMATAYGVSMNTVDRALLVLTTEGTVRGEQGRAVFIADDPRLPDA